MQFVLIASIYDIAQTVEIATLLLDSVLLDDGIDLARFDSEPQGDCLDIKKELTGRVAHRKCDQTDQ